MHAEHEQRLLDLKNEYIPVDGPLIALDMYVPNPDPKKAPKRARYPQRALEWLGKQMSSQGASLEQLENMEAGQLKAFQQAVSGGGAPQGNVAGPRQGALASPPLTQAPPVG
jgi:hypothetical protein